MNKGRIDDIFSFKLFSNKFSSPQHAQTSTILIFSHVIKHSISADSPYSFVKYSPNPNASNSFFLSYLNEPIHFVLNLVSLFST